MSVFDCVLSAAPGAAVQALGVFDINRRYQEDDSPDKANLSIGVYRDDQSRPWVLPVVMKVETLLARGFAEGKFNYEYLPIDGPADFCDAACKVLLGKDNPALLDKRAFGVHAVSGVGAQRIGFDFLKKLHCSDVVYLSSPTWGNHPPVVSSAGFADVRRYRYYDNASNGLDFTGMCEDLKNAPEHSIVVLQSDGHNPTGCDPSPAQWEEIARIMKNRGLFPFFDVPYQGFVSGDPEKDSFAVRLFVEQGLELFAAQSFSKMFGIYNERVGNLCIVTSNPDTTPHIREHMKCLIRPMWSNPPLHGLLIVTTILNDPELCREWKDNLRTMADRIIRARQMLYDKLTELKTPGSWRHIAEQKGMFCYTGLSESQVRSLAERHVYMLKDGRISISGVNSRNVDYVARAIHEVVSRTSA